MKRSAFSLLEVVLAIGLIALLAGSIVGFVYQLAERRTVLLTHSRRLVAADAMMEQIEADVFTCLAGDARRGAGVKGSATSLRILSRAVNLGMDRSSERMTMDDLRSTEYRFDEASALVTAARASVLFTDQRERTSGGGGGEGGREPILENVQRIRFRYYDNNEWLTTFDSAAAGRLPQAIEIAVWFAPIASPGATNPATTENAAAALDEIAHLDELSAPDELDDPADLGSADDLSLPPPDRLRIIVVPDAGDPAAGGPP